MTLHRSILMVMFCASGLTLVARPAQAIALPDSGSCNSFICLSIDNTNSTTGTAAIEGLGPVGVYGTSSGGTGYGLKGDATSGIGVYASATSTGNAIYATAEEGEAIYATSDTVETIYAYSNRSNAILAQNQDDSGAAATISALAAGNSGLAYYGTGGILISGNAYKPGGGSWVSSSDERIKRDVRTLSWGLEELRSVHPVTYKYNGLGGTTDDGREYVGVIAQELEKIFPSMVSSRKAKLHPTDAEETDIKLVDPSAFTFILINAVKQQQETIERQEHRIASLERGRRSSLSASVLGGGLGTGLVLGLLPLGFVVLRKRKESKTA